MLFRFFADVILVAFLALVAEPRIDAALLDAGEDGLAGFGEGPAFLDALGFAHSHTNKKVFMSLSLANPIRVRPETVADPIIQSP